MNIIFEYKNVQTTRCDIAAFAESWLNLSSYTSFSAGFRSDLEAITHTVIDANSAPNALNRSAILRIRTNEKIFQNSTAINPQSPLDIEHAWQDADWEFKQFEIDPGTHYLKQVPVTNTPLTAANYATFGISHFWPIGNSGNNEYLAMGAWIDNNKNKVASGTHSIPANYLAPVARVQGEFLHYFEIGWPPVPPNNWPSPPANVREIRRQYSLNTCQGCHNGETKTVFTHVRPLPYGEPANYWRNVSAGPPDYTQGYIDLGDGNPAINPYDGNRWQTTTPTGSVDNYPEPSGERYWQNVSAFLTGRSYSGSVSAGTYDDDETDPNKDIVPDNTLDGLFFVNDPTNGQLQYGQSLTDMVRFGFNDLKMRKTRLCQLINSSCTMEVVIPIAVTTTHIPFAVGTH